MIQSRIQTQVLEMDLGIEQEKYNRGAGWYQVTHAADSRPTERKGNTD